MFYLVLLVSFAGSLFAYERKEYTALKPAKHSKANIEAYQRFREEFRADFAKIWKDEKNLKKEYADLKIIHSSGNAEQHSIPSYKKFVVAKMKSSYKLKFASKFPNEKLTHMPEQLDDKAQAEAMYFIDERACCGPCWLCCSDVK
jgi:phosphoglycolate phosphatase-like HAD superfamily hydrolase